MKRLFGTDGIRAVAGQPPLDPSTVRTFGAALAEVLHLATGHPPRVALGRDTRESGTWLRDAVAAGLISRDGAASDVGVITTPGLSFAVQAGLFDAGVMISASHNPFEDNGLKVFGRDGTKLPDDLEREIEAKILDHGIEDPGDQGRRAAEDGSLVLRYEDFLEKVLPKADRLSGMTLVLDCANGAAHRIAPEIFAAYGAAVTTIGDAPDGRNINLGCGSLHLDRLGAAVRDRGADGGIAFDGDADRCLAVDRKGRVVDGDYILYVMARRMRAAGTLRGGAVVGTIMSNFWLERRLADEGMKLLRAPVGDKYVLERMVAEDAALGGEQSGHIIFRDRSNTGDGLLTGLLLLDALIDEDRPLETILDEIVPFPQVLLNVRVKDKPDLRQHAVIGPVVVEVERAMDGNGRVVLRYSGTEPLARVMIEGADADLVRSSAERLVEVIRGEIGT